MEEYLKIFKKLFKFRCMNTKKNFNANKNSKSKFSKFINIENKNFN